MRKTFSRLIALSITLTTGAALGPAEARRGLGVPAGAWDITWMEPRLTPATQAHVTTATRCYAAQDVARGSNPVMPPAQERQCSRTEVRGIGDDVVYDTLCNDVHHRLRLFACGTGYCGVYRWVARKGHPDQGIYESVVFLAPAKTQCQPS